VILDLEDAVAGQHKDQARAAALDYLVSSLADGALRALRSNGPDTRAGISDLAALLDSAAAPSARGLAAVEAIAVATPRLAGLMLGAADMGADLGAGGLNRCTPGEGAIE
jgi:(S)-citramalyl-CoA lyase